MDYIIQYKLLTMSVSLRLAVVKFVVQKWQKKENKERHQNQIIITVASMLEASINLLGGYYL